MRASGRPPLVSAARKGDVKKLRSLLTKEKEEADSRHVRGGALLHAVAYDHMDAALVLIEAGADVTLSTEEGNSCIRLAAMEGNVPLLSVLIDAGADVDQRDDRGATPAMWAANRGRLEALGLLIGHGADLNARDAPDWGGKTVLMYAKPERLDIIKLLLEQGADPKIRTKGGLTASEEALRQAQLEQKGPLSRPERAKPYEAKARLLQQYE